MWSTHASTYCIITIVNIENCDVDYVIVLSILFGSSQLLVQGRERATFNSYVDFVSTGTGGLFSSWLPLFH